MQIQIRHAIASDMQQVHRLVKELAAFEKAPDEVTTDTGQYIHDGFTENRFQVIIAEDTDIASTDNIVGIAFFYWAYSTWKGKYIWLEDLVITDTYRQSGIGTLLFHAVVNYAKAEGAMLVKWQVLDWNTPAIQFYEKIDAVYDKEWLTYKIRNTDFDKVLNQ